VFSLARRSAGRPSPTRWLADRKLLLLVPVLILPLPVMVNQYVLYVANLGFVYVLVGVGFNIVLGNLGQLAFANAAFFGIGAYTTSILMYHLGTPFLLAGLAGGLVSAAAGLLVSLPALRGVRSFYLAIMTLAFGELMRWTYVHAPSLTLGSMGLPVPLPEVFGYGLRTDVSKFYLFLAVVTLVTLATANLLRSGTGRAFMAIRDNELAAAAMGIPTARYIMLAFAWSGFVVGLGGALYAALVRRVSPDAFDLGQLLLHFAIVMVGGISNIAGAVIGAVVLTAAPELTRGLPGFETVLVAALMIAVLLFLPRGVVSLLFRWVPAFRDTYHRS
jgi:branched-chain amino acid transport system permease protein